VGNQILIIGVVVAGIAAIIRRRRDAGPEEELDDEV